jgi:hypothetical protein
MPVCKGLGHCHAANASSCGCPTAATASPHLAADERQRVDRPRLHARRAQQPRAAGGVHKHAPVVAARPNSSGAATARPAAAAAARAAAGAWRHVEQAADAWRWGAAGR